MLKKTVTVLGAGNFGTAVAYVLAKNGHKTRIWNWEGDILPLRQIKKYRENKKYLPGIDLSKNLEPCEKISEALDKSEIVFFAIPSGVFDHTIGFALRSIDKKAILVDLSKGVEPVSLKLIPEVIASYVGAKQKKWIVSISGPAIAGQMAKDAPTVMNIASKNKQAIRSVSLVLSNKNVKLIPTDDIVGVELGGSFKNVYAIAMGMCDAIGLPLNTKAALLTFGLEELSRLCVFMGGKKETMYGLAGVGDLVGTALCFESRNRRFGEYLGSGIKYKDALAKVGQTVEGVSATECLLRLGAKHGVDMPLASLVGDCIFSKKKPSVAINAFFKKLL